MEWESGMDCGNVKWGWDYWNPFFYKYEILYVDRGEGAGKSNRMCGVR